VSSSLVPKGFVLRDKADKVRQETRNGVIQAAYVIHLASIWTPEKRLTVELLCELQRLAVNQIYRCAGHLRDGPVRLEGCEHQPPDHLEVHHLVGAMCQYVEDHWHEPAVHVASYLMWRINWIHPFFGGNGRTARAASYLILCAKLGFVLPGEVTIPELIVSSREPYYNALRSADAAWADGQKLDISVMEELMEDLLAEQLVSIHEKATGKKIVPNG